MQLHGYHNLEEIATFLHVSEIWLATELTDFGAPTLFLCGELNWFSRDIEQFLHKRQQKISDRQKFERDLQNEATGR